MKKKIFGLAAVALMAVGLFVGSFSQTEAKQLPSWADGWGDNDHHKCDAPDGNPCKIGPF